VCWPERKHWRRLPDMGDDAVESYYMNKGEPSQICMIFCEHEETGEPYATDLVGDVLLNRLDITRLKKPGWRRMSPERTDSSSPTRSLPLGKSSDGLQAQCPSSKELEQPTEILIR
jgi:hypothetical protein